jgi:hypothetical protein
MKSTTVPGTASTARRYWSPGAVWSAATYEPSGNGRSAGNHAGRAARAGSGRQSVERGTAGAEVGPVALAGAGEAAGGAGAAAGGAAGAAGGAAAGAVEGVDVGWGMDAVEGVVVDPDFGGDGRAEAGAVGDGTDAADELADGLAPCGAAGGAEG